MISSHQKSKAPRVGIFAGAFNPVHAGHVSFALQAIQTACLDEVIFMPERRPRAKPSVEHYAHRVAMLRSAFAPHGAIRVLEVADRHFTVTRTLSGLRAIFPDAQLVMLMGSDTIINMPSWPQATALIENCEFVVGLRSEQEISVVRKSVAAWNPNLEKVRLIHSYAPDVSSSKIRHAIRTDRHTTGLLASVRRYAKREWLYVSPAYGQRTV